MFDIGWQELFIVAILALIVVGPKDMPKVLRTVTQWVRKVRSLAGEFQSGVNEMVREADLDDMRKEINQGVLDAEKDIKSEIGTDDLTKEMDDVMGGDMDTSDVEKSFEVLNAPTETVSSDDGQADKAPDTATDKKADSA